MPFQYSKQWWLLPQQQLHNLQQTQQQPLTLQV
jgi:hypothetical protein